MQPDGKWFKGIEDYVGESQYEEEKHRKAVVQDILDNWTMLSRGGKFHAILATSNIPEAIEYYGLLKGSPIKVAALFDQNIDNNGTGIIKEKSIIEMLSNYNARYGHEFRMATFAGYKLDVSLRLAHKKPYVGIESDKDKQLDLLIVVDQMLTGFDSKWINTLYLDKKLEYERLIQAFSRTNRLFGPEKPFGIIRYYRRPHTMAANVEAAFKLYSGDKPLGLFADKLENNLAKLNQIYDDIVELFSAAGVDSFEKLPEEQVEKGRFAKLFKQFNDYLEAALVQGFTWEKLEYRFQQANNIKTTITMHLDETTYLVLALRYKELFSGGGSGGGSDDVPYEIDTHLTEINTGRIDRDYMNMRFTKYLKALQDGSETTEVLNELHKSFAVLTHKEQKYAHMFLLDVQRGSKSVEDGKTLSDYIAEYQTEARNDRIHRFAAALGIDEKQLRGFISRNVTAENINDFGLYDKLLASVDRSTAREYIEKVKGQPVKPFRVPSKVDKLLRQFILSGGFDIE